MMAYQIKNVELASIQPSGFTQASIPELTRPARSILEKHKSKTQKPQGRKATKTIRPAKYHNWHTPACWSQILAGVGDECDRYRPCLETKGPHHVCRYNTVDS
jgi:hypothetical protein